MILRMMMVQMEHDRLRREHVISGKFLMAKADPKQPIFAGKTLLYGIGIAVVGGILSYFFAGPNLAAETMAMQQEVLRESKDLASSKEKIRAIMRNIDLMPTKEIYKVKKDLWRLVAQEAKRSAEKYLELSTSERTSFLDEGIEKVQVAKALFDATNQGGMPVRTQADAERYQRYREQREAAKKNPPQSKAKKPQPKSNAGEKKPPTVSPERVYFEALLKRATERNIDMGNFGRYYASGRSRRR